MTSQSARLRAFAPETKTPPPRVRTLPPSAFADSWRKKPLDPVKIGIRLVGEDVIATAQQLAVDFTNERVAAPSGPARASYERLWIDMYNSQIQRCVLCHVLTKPDDVSQRFFDAGPVNTIEVALTPETMRALWEEYQELSAELSPVTPEASDEEARELSGMLSMATVFDGLDANQERRLRRSISRLREELIASFPGG